MAKSSRNTASRGGSAKIEAMLREQRNSLVEDYQRCLKDMNEAPMEHYDMDDGSGQPDRIAMGMTLQHLSNQIRAIDQALERLSKGEYGKCSDCGEQIGTDRLKANPMAQRCLECQTRNERRTC